MNDHAAIVDSEALVLEMGAKARVAAELIAQASTGTKAKALKGAAEKLRKSAADVLAANAIDMERGTASGLSPAMLDRLSLTPERVEAIAKALVSVAELPDPVGEIIDSSQEANGLALSRVRIPIGVIGIIFESRPNVTADAGALCLMAGNASILRGGSEAIESNRALHRCLAHGLREAGLSEDSIQLVPTTDRAAVGAMLGASQLIDLVIPRGGKSLVARVQDEARVPVLAHLDGLCHTYVHEGADPDMAETIVVNAKMRRPGICGAMETLLIDSNFGESQRLVRALLEAGCEVRGDPAIGLLDKRVVPAKPDDWDTEYLEPILSVAQVDDLDAALAHIATHGSGHTEAIVTSDGEAASRFIDQVDSAIVMHNVSTQFADGAEFGLGAEIGISTGRLHARGPVALEGLTTYKWIARGKGVARP